MNKTPSVAFLLFQVAQERNFIHDDMLPAASSELARLGIENTIFEATVPAMDALAPEDFTAIDAVADRVRGVYAVCAYARLWSDAVFRRLRAQLPDVTWVYLGDARVAFEGTTHRLGYAQVAALAEIARAAVDGRSLDPASLSALPESDLRGAHGRANLVRISLGGARPDRPAVVHGSPGCAYGLDVRDNPRFADVPIPATGAVTKGCSFCATGGVPRKPAADVLASVLSQLDNVFASEPEVARIQINDQNPFPYLVQFVERASERAARPLEILIETRADWFLGALPAMERALAACERSGHKLLLFLMGIENFSPNELQLLNKGVTPEQNERAVLECRRLKRKYPSGYSDTKAAFGFILYNPWTELRDLALNAMAVERAGLEEFRGQIARSKLRLYPDTALYYKATHEGLVAESFPHAAMDSARRYGYEAEVPWRFKHAATDTAYGVHDAVITRIGKHSEMKMLLEIVRFLERRPESVGQPPDALARELVAQMGSRFDREIRHRA